MAKKLFSKVNEKEDIVRGGDNILYLVLIIGEMKHNEDEEYKDWFMLLGRQAVYDRIKQMLLSEEDEDMEYLVDIENSIIYADNPNIPDENNKLRISNGISLHRFMTDCFVLGKVYVDENDGFDIEDYANGEIKNNNEEE